jgi:uncharacterized caspase-like protein
MSKIIISYRRSSYDAIAGRIRDKFAAEYGSDAVYMDVDNIPFGTDFRRHIDNALTKGDVLVAVIGPKWLGPIKGRKPRIFDQTDPVRIEIETALKREIEVVPILVDGAKMPAPDELPESINQLAYHNAAIVDAGRDFHQHMERVIRSMNPLMRSQIGSTPDKTYARVWKRIRSKWLQGLTVAATLGLGIFAFEQPFHQWLGPLATANFRSVDTAAPIPGNSKGDDRIGRVPAMSIAPAAIGKHVALVIGNGKYENVAHLQNTVNDAISVSDMFRSLGYTVITRTNIGISAFNNALRAFHDEAVNADIAVVYYAGHGIEVAGTNYLFGTDARVENESDLKREAVPFDAIIAATEGAKRLRLLILDACRDNPFVSAANPNEHARSLAVTERESLESIAGTGPESTTVTKPAADATTKSPQTKEKGLVRVEVPSNTLIAYAAKAGSFAEDGDSEHSPFALAIIKNLTTPDLDVRIALGRVRDEVFKSTAGHQEPFIYGSLGGDMVSLAPTLSTAK